MASLSNKIREYAKANGINEVDFLNDVMLQDDSNGKGAYIKKWNLDIAQPTQAQLDALDAQADFNIVIKNLRAKRNKLLADTDYTVLQDSTFTDAQVAEWVVYRQALRDITEGLTTKEQVEAVVFPTKP
jgi:hypothetical protein